MDKNIYSNNENKKAFQLEPVIKSHKNEINIYYSIFLPDNLQVQEKKNLIFTDKIECLNILKKHPGARFKAFSTLDEATRFSECGLHFLNSNGTHDESSITCNEKASAFRGPKSQDLIKFRKAIEKGDNKYFEECIEQNPRYLVSSGDTPAILQEGSRYNALHISCRNNQSFLCQRILNIVENENLFQRLYPDDSVEISRRRSSFLLDLYLNTPDKGLNETPLHFSSKYGSIGCMQVLISYQNCDKTRQNKYGELPIEIICSRMSNATSALKKNIEELLGEQYYVPVLRDDDNCLYPRIGLPWSPGHDGTSLANVDSNIGPPKLSSSPISPSFKVKGYAGPMSPQKADSFYNKWKHSVLSPSRQKKFTHISLLDPEKGVERMGRSLASEFNVEWQEYWPFLGTFVNLPSEEGLAKLEKHLQYQYKKVVANENDENCSRALSSLQERLGELNYLCSEDNRSLNLSELSQYSSTSIEEICKGLEALRLNVSLSPLPNNSEKSFNFSKLPVRIVINEVDNNANHSNNNSENQTNDVMTSEYFYNFIIQSVNISSQKFSNILIDAVGDLKLHLGPEFGITLDLKKKIRREISTLLDVIVKNLDGSKTNLDLSFVHPLLTVKITNFVMENLTNDKIHLLSSTIKYMLENINFFHESSSDEEDIEEEMNIKNVDVTEQLICFVSMLERTLEISSGFTNTMEDHKVSLADLGKCSCHWVILGERVISHNKNTSLSSSFSKLDNCTYKFNRARSFLQRLFKESNEDEHREIIKKLSYSENETGNLPEEEINEDGDSFVSAASSLEDEEGRMVTPEEMFKFYINGTEPTKVDFDVLCAVDGMDIDAKVYPYISMWQTAISAITLEEKQRMASFSHSVTSSSCSTPMKTPPKSLKKLNF